MISDNSRRFRHIFTAAFATLACAFVLAMPTSALAVCGDTILDAGETCDDGNILDGDCCSSTCLLATNEGLSCDDGQACNIGETCQLGSCTGGAAPDCSTSGDQCNTASCNGAGTEGNCATLTPVANGLSCDDGQACNIGETCQLGSCTGGAAPDCSTSGDQCNTASCNGAGTEGNCATLTPVANGLSCDDGQACNIGETCQLGSCTGGAAPDCSTSGDQCNTASCNGAGTEGNCATLTPVANGLSCDDGQACNIGETCQLGSCTGGAAPDCSTSGDQCNTASCNGAGTEGNCATLTPVANGLSCDDGQACNIGETCQLGSCTGGAAPDCSTSGDQCNTASCNGAGTEGNCATLTPVANGLSCDDGQACNIGETCQLGSCTGGAAPDCSTSGDQCNTASCNGAGTEGNCATLTPVANGLSCDDGQACNIGETCQLGSCTGGAAPDCSAFGGQCNTASCNGAGVEGNCATLTPVANGLSCDDGQACNIGETCQLGSCTGGAAPDCSTSGDQCNTASCNGAGTEGNCATLTPVANGLSCDDGQACNIGETCQLGSCTGGAAQDCSAFGGQCNTASCNGAGVEGNCATLTPVTNGTTCDDGAFCTATDVCSGGVCLGSVNPCSGGDECANVCDEGSNTCNVPALTPCDDGDVCTNNLCDGSGGCAVVGNTAAQCDDGIFCNGVDTCSGGVCGVHAGDPCSSGSQCADICDEGNDTCNLPFGAVCTDGNVCTDNQCDGNGTCSAVNNVDPCNDGLFCTQTDVCNGSGVCVGVGDTCSGAGECAVVCNEGLGGTGTCADPAGTSCTNDGNICTDNQCNGVGNCVPVANTAPCNDGLFCTQTDVCSGGMCGGSGDPCAGGGDCSDTCDDVNNTCNLPITTPCTSDGNVCTNNICNGLGLCIAANNTDPCDDGLYCTQTDVCNGTGACVGVGDPCAGGVECVDSCNEIDDTCLATAGTPCTDDGNVCTTEQCDGIGQCVTSNNTLPCDDGLFCSGTDTCAAGLCVSSGDPCAGGAECGDICDEVGDTCDQPITTPCSDDGNVCTTDICNGLGACIHPNNTDPCDDGVFCNGADTCNAGACSVNTGDPCSLLGECAGSCDEVGDQCAVSAGTPCVDDGNPCTDDFCDGSGSCSHIANSSPCNDGLFCNGADTCFGGTCSIHDGDPCTLNLGFCGGVCNESFQQCDFTPAFTPCEDDGNVCTDNVCDGGGICASLNNAAACDDNLFCNGSDVCMGGLCTQHFGDPCLGGDGDGDCSESCDEPTDTCTAQDQNGTVCDDGVFCNGADTCALGFCTVHSGDPCSAGTQCANTCDETAGNCNLPNGSSCDDGISCTFGDQCIAGQCQAGSPVNTVCADGLVCNGDEICDPTIGCLDGPDVVCDLCTTNGCSEITAGCVPIPGPRETCRQPDRASVKMIRPLDNEFANKMTWKWRAGDPTDIIDFGVPTDTTDYALCVYDTLGNVASSAITLKVDPGDAWRAKKGGQAWGYRNKSFAQQSGVSRIKLRPGIEKGRLKLTAKGEFLPLPKVPTADLAICEADPRVIVQMVNRELQCWDSDFVGEGIRRNALEEFIGKQKN